MKKIASFFRDYYHVMLFAAFAVIIFRTFFAAGIQGADYAAALRLRNGFFSAVTYSAGEMGFAAGFLYNLFLSLPVVIWRVIAACAVVGSVWFASRIAGGNQKLTLTCAVVSYALVDISILRPAVYDISGSVRFVFPTLLLFAAFVLSERILADGKERPALPILVFAASVLGYQAAVAAFILCLFHLISDDKRGVRITQLLSVILAAAALALHFVLGSVPLGTLSGNFGERLADFFSLAMGYSGFFSVFLLACAFTAFGTFRRELAPGVGEISPAALVFRLALFALTAITALVLVMYSPVLTVVEIRVPIAMTFVLLTEVALLLSCVLRFRSGEDTKSLSFMLASLVTLAVTFPTAITGGEFFLIPIAMFSVFLIRVGADNLDSRWTSLIACAAAALYLAVKFTSGAGFIIASAVIVFALTAGIFPTAGKYRPTAAIAVAFAVIQLLHVASGYADNFYANAENSRRIADHDNSGTLILVEPDSREYAVPTSTLDGEEREAFLEYNGLSEDTRIVFAKQSD